MGSWSKLWWGLIGRCPPPSMDGAHRGGRPGGWQYELHKVPAVLLQHTRSPSGIRWLSVSRLNAHVSQLKPIHMARAGVNWLLPPLVIFVLTINMYGYLCAGSPPLKSKRWYTRQILLIRIRGCVERQPGPQRKDPMAGLARLKIFQFNMAGWVNNSEFGKYISRLPQSQTPDIILIQETKLARGVVIKLPRTLMNYKIAHQVERNGAQRTDLRQKGAGGLLTLIRDSPDLTYDHLPTPTDTRPAGSPEEITEIARGLVRYGPDQRHAFVVANVYSPNTGSGMPGDGQGATRATQRVQTFEAANVIDGCCRDECGTIFPQVVVAGDFNAHHTTWGPTETDDKGADILDYCWDSGMEVANTGATTRHSRTDPRQRCTAPDLTLYTPSLEVSDWHVLEGTSCGSDHKIISFMVTSADCPIAPPLRKHEKRATRYSLRRADWDGFNEHLERHLTTSPRRVGTWQDRYLDFVKGISAAAQAHIPRGGRGNATCWWDNEMDALAAERDDAAGALDAATIPEERQLWMQEYCLRAERVREALRTKRQAHWATFCEGLSLLSSTSSVYRVIKGVGSNKPDCSVPTLIRRMFGGPHQYARTDEEKAKAFNEHYQRVSCNEAKTSARQIAMAKARSIKRSNVSAFRDRRNSIRRKVARQVRITIHNPTITQVQDGTRADTLPCNALFTMDELQSALRDSPGGKAPGLDEVHIEMLKHLSDVLLGELLSIVNASWAAKDVPAAWRLGCIIPILKGDSATAEPSSYRPVCLTSEISKVVERMVTHRMMRHLEMNHLLPDDQYAYRADRSTTSALMMANAIAAEGFKVKPTYLRTLIAALDLSKAFDSLDWIELAQAMEELGVPGCFIAWYASFLRDRKYVVRVNSTTSKQKRYFGGVPQGTVSGPSLWVIYIAALKTTLRKANNVVARKAAKDWKRETDARKTVATNHSWPKMEFQRAARGTSTMPSALDQAIKGHVLYACHFADDLNFLIMGPSPTRLRHFMQGLLRRVGGLLRCRYLTVARNKLKAMVIHRYSDHSGGWTNKGTACPTLSIQGTQLEWVASMRCLGTTLNYTLTQEENVAHIRKKVSKRLSQLRAIACRDWGSSPRVLRTCYMSYILSVIRYGGAAWWAICAETHRAKLRALHHAGARILTGCTRSTDICSLLLEADLKPLDYYFEIDTAVALEQLRRAPVGTLRHSIATEARGAGSAYAYWQDLAEEQLYMAEVRAMFKDPPRILRTGHRRRNPAAIGRKIYSPDEGVVVDAYPRVPTLLASVIAPWDTAWMSKIDIRVTLNSPAGLSEEAIKADKLRIARTAINELKAGYHGQPIIEAYTDGSVQQEFPHHGAGAYKILPNQAVPLTIGPLCSSMRAEAVTLAACLEAIPLGHEADTRPVLLFTDSQSTLAGLASGPLRQRSHVLERIWTRLRQVSFFRNIHLQFIYAHCGISHNETVDGVAGLRLERLINGQERQPDPPPLRELAGVRRVLVEKWQLNWQNRMASDAAARTAEGKTPHPRLSSCRGLHPSRAVELESMSRPDAVLVRQLRVGETVAAGTFRARLYHLADDWRRCRWCGGATETIIHLFDHCQAVEQAREEAGRGLPPQERFSDALYGYPYAALHFYRAVLRMLPVAPPLPARDPPPPPPPPMPPEASAESAEGGANPRGSRGRASVGRGGRSGAGRRGQTNLLNFGFRRGMS